MDRQIPDVWNIFSLAGPDYHNRPQYNHHHQPPNFHLNWNAKSQDLLHRWCDRSSPCDRPRTYDKFYHKVPGNYIDPSSKSLCSSEADEPKNEDTSAGSNGKKKRKKKRDRKYSRTITEREVRHLDRHLSMKKTIRKKIMRDLQQAFVHDNESPDNLDLNRLNFDPKKKAVNDANLLDLLKQPPAGSDPSDSGHGTDPGPSPSQSVERASKNVRKMQKSYLVSDSSSCGGYESAESEKDIIVLAAEQIEATEQLDSVIMEADLKANSSGKSVKCQQNPKKKKSFWQKLTANLKGSSS